MILKRCAGVLLHPTSLYGKHGIGDLGQACYEFIDFLHASHQKIWQVLPINPISIGNSPDQSFSTFAKNYLLISPEILLQKKYLSSENLTDIPNFDQYNVDYERVAQFKSNLFRIAFANFCKDIPKKFIEFCEENSDWLDDYSLFLSLKNYFVSYRTKNKNSAEIENDLKKLADMLPLNLVNDYYFGAVWSTWPQDIVQRDKNCLDKWRKIFSDEILYHKFLQFEFFEQWIAIKNYANSKNVSIIGDIPIFVAYDSADVWVNKNLFELDSNFFPTVIAGVPPDYFSTTGQLWGNPLYKWSAHKNSGYNWWIKRIKNIFQYVNILRIDHFRGFESYWAVPFGEKTAVNGKWEIGPGKNFFDIVEKKLGKLPIIAEDLGIITEKVLILRDSCNFPGMKILQFAFDGTNNNYHLPHNFETTNIVAYTGTHDNDTTVGWYEKSPENFKDQFRRYMNVSGNDPAWDLIKLLYSSVAAYAIVPIQDLMGLNSSARMNLPGNSNDNWRFRFTKQMLSDEIKNKLLYFCNLFNR